MGAISLQARSIASLISKISSTQKELKSFLGFANWLRDHVQDFAKLAHSLNNMLQNYNKKRKLQLTETV